MDREERFAASLNQSRSVLAQEFVETRSLYERKLVEKFVFGCEQFQAFTPMILDPIVLKRVLRVKEHINTIFCSRLGEG